MIRIDDRILILGGARSGKSLRGEALAAAWSGSVNYVATSRLMEGDEEWSARVAAHRSRRPAEWATHEAPVDLPETLLSISTPCRLLFVDCLTVWLGNCLFELGRDRNAELLEVIGALPGPVLFISNEVGMGIVPENALGRQFRDLQGRLNAQVAEISSRVELVVAGIPVPVKGTSL